MPVRTTGERGEGLNWRVGQEARPGVEDGDPAEIGDPAMDVSVDLGLMGDANACPQPDDDNPPPRPEMSPSQATMSTSFADKTSTTRMAATPPVDEPDGPIPGPEF